MSTLLSKAQRLFVELGPGGVSDWVQIAPGPGKWTSPRYGPVTITDKDLREMKDNFDRKVYQEHIAVDAEHQTKLSGALGYYRDLKVDNGLWAKIEMTDRGAKLLSEGRFKYFSPEFYEVWEDPATNRVYTNVLTGGAFTTKPFFKDASLPALSFSELEFCEKEEDPAEEAVELAEAVTSMVWNGFNDGEIKIAFDAALAYAHATQRPVAELLSMAEMDMTDVHHKTLMKAMMRRKGNPPEKGEEENMGDEKEPMDIENLQKQFTESETARGKLEADLRQMSETNAALAGRVEAMEAAERQRRFSEMALGRGGAGDGSPAWIGGPEAHVPLMESLAKTFGEDSEQFKAYAENATAAAKAVTESKLFTEVGRTTSDAQKPNTATGGIEAAIKEYTEKHPDATREVATHAVLAANPKLYSEYNQGHMAQSARGQHGQEV